RLVAGGASQASAADRSSPGLWPNFTFEGTAEAGGVRKAQIVGDQRDRLRARRIGQHRTRFEQPLTPDVAGYTSGILEQSIEIGSRHYNQRQGTYFGHRHR